MARQFKPDEGWAWVVLVAAFLANVIFDGVTMSFGVYYPEFLDHFRAGKGLTSWVGASTPAMYAFVGPLAGALANRYGCRLVTVMGTVIAAAGFILSTFSPNIWVMILTYGLVGGAGFGLMHLCTYVIVGHYFDKRRALATGIASCGSGIGTFIFAPFGSYLISVYAWQGALLITSGIILNGVVLAMTYRPVPPPQTEEEDKPEKKRLLGLDWSLLRNPVFLVYGLSAFLCALGFFVPFMVLPSVAMRIDASNPHKGALLISIVGIANTVGRVAFGWVADRPWGDALKIYVWVLTGGGLATICVPWITSYALLALYACGFGLTVAAYIAMAPVLLVEFLGLSKLSDSFGFLNFFRGAACFIGPPIAGFLHDYTGDYTLGLGLTGAVITLAGVLCLPLRAIHRCVNPKPEFCDEMDIHADERRDNVQKKTKLPSLDFDELPGIFH